MDENTILIIGQAKPAHDDAIFTVHGEFYLGLYVDRRDGKILKAECNTILDLTSEFVTELLCGKSLLSDMDELSEAIKTRYFALTQKPLLACLKDAYNRFTTAVKHD